MCGGRRDIFQRSLINKILIFKAVSSLFGKGLKRPPYSTNLKCLSYMSMRSQISLIMRQVIPDQSVLSALEIEKLNSNSLFGIYPHC